MDQGSLQTLHNTTGFTRTAANGAGGVCALVVSDGCERDDLASVLDGLGWDTRHASNADSAATSIRRARVDVLVMAGTAGRVMQPHGEELLALAKKRHLPTIIIGDGAGLVVEGMSPLVTRIPERTSPDELRGRLAMVQQYHGMLRSVERELNQMQKLSERLSDHFREVDEGMKLAGRLQRDFLPDLSEPFCGVRFAFIFQPATWVSGDMFDVFRIDDHRTGVYLADAVGHGMSASLLTMFIKRAIVPMRDTSKGIEAVSPSEVLAVLNDALAEQELPNCQFITACYGIIDHQAQTFTFARGGHPYPVKLSRGGGPEGIKPEGIKAEEIKVVGGLLGLFVGAEFPSTTVQLAPGDKVVLYTDGIEHIVPRVKSDTSDVTEAIGELFGALACGSLVDGMKQLESRLQEDIDESLPQDDLTILAFEMPS